MSESIETGTSSTVAAELAALLPKLPRTKITPQTISQNIIDRWYGYEAEYRQTIAELRTELAAATERATTAEAETTRLRKANHDLAKHDLASMNRASAAEDALAELQAQTGDDAGWTAAENAEFEKLYGIQAAMRLRAANDRVWQIVKELRTAAVKAGRDPYQDPMAQRLSAALVGEEKAANDGD